MDVQLNLVFEHQSEFDALMAARFLCHTGAIWNQARKEGSPKMPLVINVVLHTGQDPWRGPLDLSAAIHGGEHYAKHAPELLPTLPIFIDDLPGVTDAEIRAREMTAAVKLALLVLKHSRSPDAVQTLQRASDLIRDMMATPEGEDVLRETVRYLLQVNPAATVQAVREVLKEPLGARGEQVAMTEGERLIEQGRLQGEARGREQGREQGREEVGRKFANAVIRLLERRGFDVPADVRTHIQACTDADVLARWSERALTASSALEVIRE